MIKIYMWEFDLQQRKYANIHKMSRPYIVRKFYIVTAVLNLGLLDYQVWVSS